MKKTITHDAAIEELYQGGALGFSRAGAEALVTYNVPKEIDDAVDDLNHAVIMLNSAVDALGRNPQDIQKGERDE